MEQYAADLIQSDLSQSVGVQSPAAGSGFTVKVAQSEFWKPRSLCFQMVTSSTVASRIVYLDLIDGAGIKIARASAGFTQTASLTTVYTFALGITQYGANAAASIGAPLPDVWLRPGCKLTVGVTAIDTGDAITAVNLTVDQVFTGSYSA